MKAIDWKIEDNTLELTWGYSKIKTIGHVKLGVLVVTFQKIDYFDFKLLRLTMEYWEKYTREKGCKMIFVSENSYRYHFYKLQYHSTSSDLNHFVQKLPVYKQVAKGTKRKIVKNSNEFVQYFQEKKKENKTFEFNFPSPIIMENVTIYYKGLEAEIETTFDKGSLYFKIKKTGHQFKAKDHSEIKTALDCLFEKIEQMVRIRNQFNPPKKFFKRKMYESLNLSDDQMDYIHNVLLTKMTWEEIEDHFYSERNAAFNSKIMKNPYTKHIFIEILDELFMVNGDDIEYFKKEQKENALLKLQSIIKDAMEKETKKRFDSLYVR